MSAAAIKNRVWWTTLIVVPLGFVALLDRWFVSVADLDSAWLVKHAQAVASSEATFEKLPESNWRTVAMPNFAITQQSVPPRVWYRTDVAVDQPQRIPWAIYIVGPAAKYSIFLNGQFIGESGQVVLPMPQHIEPLIFRFPGELLRAGANQIYLQSVSDRPRTVLQSMHVGPDAELTPGFQTALFALTTLKQITVGGLIAMGIVMLVLSGSRSREAVFGWYAVASLFMAAHIGIRLMASVPFGDPQIWKNSVDIALAGYLVCAAFFINRFLNAPHDRFEKWFACWGLLGAAVMVLDPLVFNSSVPWFFHRVWLPIALPICIYQARNMIRAANIAPNIENRLLALLCCVGLAIGIVDGSVGVTSLASTIYLPYAMGPVLCAFWFFLLRRFVRALNSAESSRDELEWRIQEKTRELADSLVRVKDMEREKALSAERERIMRDMHDGVGAQLVQALSIATSRPELKTIEEPLRGCLEELRLIIDSIEPVNGNLASVLGTLRLRMTRRLKEAAIQLRWNVDDIPILSDFGPSRVLHVSRIVHEAIANALKHSHAKQIILSAFLVPGESHSSVVIEVADNGVGMGSDVGAPQSCGRGLENMRRRAEELNAHLSVDFESRGTTVRLVLPIAKMTTRDLPLAQAPNLA